MAGSGAESSPGVLNGLGQFGRYFQLVAVVPSAVLVVPLAILIVGGAPTERPTTTRAAKVISEQGLRGAALILLGIVIVGQVIHPFQFAATQFLEGRWGVSHFARTAIQSRARLHLDKRRRVGEAAGTTTRISRTLLSSPLIDPAKEGDDHLLVATRVDSDA